MKAERIIQVASLVALSLSGTAGHAARAGDLILQGGWFFISPQESSEPLQTELAPSLIGNALGIEQNFSAPGTSVSVSDSNTPALTASYFLTDHFVIKLEGGVPADFELSGEGVVRPTGLSGALINVDLGAPENNPLSTARQWSPAVLGQYYFRDPGARLRPYLGLGVTYTWFDDIELNDRFRQSINRNFGATLALATGNPGPTHVEGDSESDIAPIFNAGLSVGLSERLSLSFSVSYVALETTSAITISAENGTQLAQSTTQIDLNPIVSSVLLSYRWGGD